MCQFAIAILILSSLFTLSASAGLAREEPENEQLTIQHVEVDVVRSVPTKIFVHIHGVILNGCTELGEIVQHRDDHTIMVKIPTIVHQQICTMMARLIDNTIQLNGDFAPGDYEVDVNGTVKQFRV
jgi:hypothetical protein